MIFRVRDVPPAKPSLWYWDPTSMLPSDFVTAVQPSDVAPGDPGRFVLLGGTGGTPTPSTSSVRVTNSLATLRSYGPADRLTNGVYGVLYDAKNTRAIFIWRVGETGADDNDNIILPVDLVPTDPGRFVRFSRVVAEPDITIRRSTTVTIPNVGSPPPIDFATIISAGTVTFDPSNSAFTINVAGVYSIGWTGWFNASNVGTRRVLVLVSNAITPYAIEIDSFAQPPAPFSATERVYVTGSLTRWIAAGQIFGIWAVQDTGAPMVVTTPFTLSIVKVA